MEAQAACGSVYPPVTSMAAASWLLASALWLLESARAAQGPRPASTVLPHSAVAVTAAWRAFHRIGMTAFCPTQSLPTGLASRGHDGKPLVSATFNRVSDGIRTHDIQDHNNAVRQHRTPKPLLYRDFWSADGHDHTR